MKKYVINSLEWYYWLIMLVILVANPTLTWIATASVAATALVIFTTLMAFVDWILERNHK